MHANAITRIFAAGCLGVLGWIALTPAPADAPRPEAAVSPVAARIVAKTILAQQLRAGRLSAAEAAAVFAWLNGQAPVLMGDGSDPCQAVLNWGEQAAGGKPADNRCGGPRSRSPLRLPSVIEADCRELFARATDAAQRNRVIPVDGVDIDDLRLVEGRRSPCKRRDGRLMGPR
jgi:hypothetical protein